MFIALVDILLVGIVLAAFAFGLRPGIAALIAIRPLTDRLFELASFDVAGQHMTYGVTMNIILFCAGAISFVKIQHSTPSKLRNIWLPFLLVCAVAVLYSPLQFDAARRVWIYLCFYLMFGLSFAIVKSERDVVFFLKLVIVSSVLPVLYGLFQTFSRLDMHYDSRIESTFSHPNMFAFYILAVIGVIVFLTTAENIRITGRLRLFLNLYLLPLLIVLIMTKTRSAWIGCVLIFFVYGLVHDRRVLVLMMVAGPLVFAIPAVSERVINLISATDYIGGPAVQLNSYAWRSLLWENAFTYIWQKPIFGYGLHSFPFYSAEFFSPAPGGTFAHNDYVQVLFETGVVGLMAFLWIFLRCFAWLIRRRRFDKAGVAVAVAILTAYLACSYSDNLLEYLPFQWEFWFPFGVMCWHIERCRACAGGLSGQRRFAKWSRLTKVRVLPAAGVATRGGRPNI